MANYTKREERKANIQERMAMDRPRREAPEPSCACGAPGTLVLSEWEGTTFYCAACVPEEWKTP